MNNIEVIQVEKSEIFKCKVNLKVSCTLNFSINCIFNHFVLTFGLLTAGLFTPTKSRIREGKNEIARVKVGIKTEITILSIDFRVKTRKKIWKIGSEELLFLIKALQGALASLLSDKLAGRKFC